MRQVARRYSFPRPAWVVTMTFLAANQSIPALIDRASKSLAGAWSSAEILEARDISGLAYDLAKKTARLAKAKGARTTHLLARHTAPKRMRSKSKPAQNAG